MPDLTQRQAFLLGLALLLGLWVGCLVLVAVLS
jgi:hypothetical protein